MKKPETIRQMKVWLDKHEHVIVTTAARVKNMGVGDYMKHVINQAARQDAKEILPIIEAIGKETV